ncbi:MAG: hypothetical protein OEZ43_18340 [Gammaproteobacteria bacterium]|nr:hypothetical protein [Gammaproteobacteria bacterium]
MNALQVHNYTQAVVSKLYSLQRSSEAKTAQHLRVVDVKQEVSAQKVIEGAIEDVRIGNHTKGVIIDIMA